MHIQPNKAGGINVFVVSFPDDRQPLVITCRNGGKGTAFWTSVPERGQTEAEENDNEIEQNRNKAIFFHFIYYVMIEWVL